MHRTSIHTKVKGIPLQHLTMYLAATVLHWYIKEFRVFTLPDTLCDVHCYYIHRDSLQFCIRDSESSRVT